MADVQTMIYDVYAGRLDVIISNDAFRQLVTIVDKTGNAYHPDALNLVMDEIERNLIVPLQNFSSRWTWGRDQADFANFVNSILDQISADIDIDTLARNIIDAMIDE